MLKKIAILASGGNSPGMNNVIITLVRKAASLKIKCELINDGYKGLVNNLFFKPILQNLTYFYASGNVIIGSSRFPEMKKKEVLLKAKKNLVKHKIDCLFVIGGDGSYRGALELSKLGVHVICIPGTIDNDIASTSKTIGFSTALNSIVSSIDNIRNSFDSHNGIILVEVMGRRFPDLAICAAFATQAEGVVTTDNILSADEIIEISKQSAKNGHRSCLIIVCEKIYGFNGLPTLKEIADLISKKTKRHCRVDVLGYIQRGGTPTAEDRILASRMGSFAVDYARKNKKSAALCYKFNKIFALDLHDSINCLPKKTNSIDLLDYFSYNKF